ncbi:MAG: hypothetical protein IPQ06_05415 [Chitinophagaceae bacterium]|nr:hypothetical protein [Chitinophagaceae bacterium]MBK9570651.1 hypothetical protein [Chitinophagaceae bacterium]MBL0272508.1 hypothetical protein [Chitinophagaceae bacterium]
MKTYVLLLFSFTVLVPACRQKKKVDNKKFISVLSLIKKQVAHVDTSLYSIMKVVYYDSLHSDTTYIPREEFEVAAADFLAIPDLSDQKVAKRYKEEPARYDELLNRVIITYTPLNPEREEIKSQELLVTPNVATGDKVNNIIILREISDRDSFLQKKMLWQMDRSFQVITTRQEPGKPEIIITTKVSWNEETDQ